MSHPTSISIGISSSLLMGFLRLGVTIERHCPFGYAAALEDGDQAAPRILTLSLHSRVLIALVRGTPQHPDTCSRAANANGPMHLSRCPVLRNHILVCHA